MKFSFFLSVAVASASATAFCQDDPFNPLGRELPIEDMQKQLRIQVEWIELSHEMFTELMAAEDTTNPPVHNSGNDGPLREQVAELIEKDEARIIDTASVIARSGQRAKTESILEYIYPTEYDPPEAAGGSAEKGDDDDEDSSGRPVVLPPNPVAFETRNIGTTLEVDPVIGADGVSIDLNLAPEIVYLADHSLWGAYETDEAEVEVQMPSFYTMRLTTSLATIAGQYVMAGVMSPFDMEAAKADTERKVMVFVRSEMLVVGLQPEQETEEE